MARTRNEIVERIRARQREAREKRQKITRYPTSLPSAERIMAMVDPESGLEWFALLVAPQKEFAVQEILARKGIPTYCPTDRRWRKISRYVKDKELKSFPLVPGYVFAGLPRGRANWYEIAQMNLVRGCVGHYGRPTPMLEKPMQRMIRRFRNGFQRPDAEKYMATYKEFAVGQKVRFSDGPWRELDFIVSEIKGSHARILMSLFGVDHVVDVEAEILEPAA